MLGPQELTVLKETKEIPVILEQMETQEGKVRMYNVRLVAFGKGSLSVKVVETPSPE